MGTFRGAWVHRTRLPTPPPPFLRPRGHHPFLLPRHYPASFDVVMEARFDSAIRALHSLRDIDGVYGSFVLNAAGEPTARDLPAVFDDRTLAESGFRIVRLWEVVSEGSPPEYAMLEFSEYSLFLRRVGEGCLCVVVPAHVNVLALRLASKWVVRHFDPNMSRTLS